MGRGGIGGVRVHACRRLVGWVGVGVCRLPLWTLGWSRGKIR